MALEMIVLTPDQKTRRVKLEGQRLTVGRSHANDLSYPQDASLSRAHLLFESGDGGWLVKDLGSKNGTLVNDTRLSGEHLLQPGDRLTAGRLVLTLIDPSAKSPEVVFVKNAGPEIAPDATVVASLDGLLSADATAPVQAPDETGKRETSRGHEFNSPVVRVLLRAGRELGEHRPLDELFPFILELSIEAVTAERGVLMTLEAGQLVASAVHGEGFRISTTVRDRVLNEKTSILVRDLQQDKLLREQVSISEQQIHTMMAVPLQTRDRVIGLIYVDSRSFIQEFTPDDLNLLTVLANVAANRIEQQRSAERVRDLEAAARIQRDMLPRDAPRVAGIDLAGHNAACRTVGGDYYAYFAYPDGRVGLVLADVAGKGMEAALLMSHLHAIVQLLAEQPPELTTMMSRLDRIVARNCPMNRFITLFFGLIDPANRTLRYCNAGHNPALLIRSSGEVERLTAAGTVLGILPEHGYEEHCQKFGPGDLVALYSDGVTEAESVEEEEFGESRLTELLVAHRGQSAESIVSNVLESLGEWVGPRPPEDDITLVAARVTGSS